MSKRRIVLEWSDDSCEITFDPPLKQVAGHQGSLFACYSVDSGLARVMKAFDRAQAIAAHARPRARKKSTAVGREWCTCRSIAQSVPAGWDHHPECDASIARRKVAQKKATAS